MEAALLQELVVELVLDHSLEQELVVGLAPVLPMGAIQEPVLMELVEVVVAPMTPVVGMVGMGPRGRS